MNNCVRKLWVSAQLVTTLSVISTRDFGLRLLQNAISVGVLALKRDSKWSFT